MSSDEDDDFPLTPEEKRFRVLNEEYLQTRTHEQPSRSKGQRSVSQIAGLLLDEMIRDVLSSHADQQRRFNEPRWIFILAYIVACFLVPIEIVKVAMTQSRLRGRSLRATWWSPTEIHKILAKAKRLRKSISLELSCALWMKYGLFAR